MLRLCDRPECSAPAAATFTFDSRHLTVWLDPPHEGGARAGDLCTRHAGRLVPPRGWHVEDRRPDPVTVDTPAEAGWSPHFDPEDDLGGLLDARSPLLGRAFRNARAG